MCPETYSKQGYELIDLLTRNFSFTVLEVSDNELSEIILKCLNNFSLMATINTPDDLFTDLEYSSYELEGLVLVTVRRELEYKEILKYVRMVDLSSKNFFGSIPTELSQLFGLRFLNMSQNHLMGRIPQKIGRMTSLLFDNQIDPNLTSSPIVVTEQPCNNSQTNSLNHLT